jgi:hypothetical protein
LSDIKINHTVRLTSFSWKSDADFVKDGIHYSFNIPLDQADGLIALYDPTEELLRFKGPKLWYTYEPQWHSHYCRNPVGKKLVKTLKNSEWAYYANPDVRYRVPHIVAADDLRKVRADQADMISQSAVATVSNFGGRLWFLNRQISLRNRIILSPLVRLYGRSTAWSNFRHFPQFWKREAPKNYMGDVGGGHLDDNFIKFLSGYKVCVCLENSCEPYYFTEKFVNAVRAGCIPIYHAHSTVKEAFLNGAFWIDPQDFNFNPIDTIEYALSQDIQTFRDTNDAWLDSGILNKMTFSGFWEQICSIMEYKLGYRV